LYPVLSLQAICYVFGKSRQAYYKNLIQVKETGIKEAIIIKLVQEIRKDLPRIGVRKLLFMLEKPLASHNISIGRDQLFSVLSMYGLLVRKRRRTRPFTTDSNHPFRKYPNLIRELDITRPIQLWVSDITFISLDSGFCYLSLVTDAYSRKIVGHCLWHNQKREMVVSALEMALEGVSIYGPHKLIHHSDRGLQYCSGDYTALLSNNNVSISMTEKSDPYENAIAERVNGILKEEFYLDLIFDDITVARETVDKAIFNYNHKRPHASCNYMTPHQAHQTTEKLKSKWRKNK